MCLKVRLFSGVLTWTPFKEILDERRGCVRGGRLPPWAIAHRLGYPGGPSLRCRGRRLVEQRLDSSAVRRCHQDEGEYFPVIHIGVLVSNTTTIRPSSPLRARSPLVALRPLPSRLKAKVLLYLVFILLSYVWFFVIAQFSYCMHTHLFLVFLAIFFMILVFIRIIFICVSRHRVLARRSRFVCCEYFGAYVHGKLYPEPSTVLLRTSMATPLSSPTRLSTKCIMILLYNSIHFQLSRRVQRRHRLGYPWGCKCVPKYTLAPIAM